jgi:hypothetical protein
MQFTPQSLGVLNPVSSQQNMSQPSNFVNPPNKIPNLGQGSSNIVMQGGPQNVNMSRFSNFKKPEFRGQRADNALIPELAYGQDMIGLAKTPADLANLEQILASKVNLSPDADYYADLDNLVTQDKKYIKFDQKIRAYLNSNDEKSAKETYEKMWRQVMKDEPGEFAGTSLFYKRLNGQIKGTANLSHKAQMTYVKRLAENQIKRLKTGFAQNRYGLNISKIATSRYEQDPQLQAQFENQYNIHMQNRVAKLASQNKRYTQAMQLRDQELENAFKAGKTYYVKPKKPRASRLGDPNWTDPNAAGYIDVDGRQLDENVFGADYSNMKFLRLEDSEGKLKRLPGYAQKGYLPYQGPKDNRYLIHTGQAEIQRAIYKHLKYILKDKALAKRIKIDKDVLFILREAEEAIMRKFIYALVGSYLHLESSALKPKLRVGLEHFYHLLKSPGGKALIQKLDMLKLTDMYAIAKETPEQYYQSIESGYEDFTGEANKWVTKLPKLKPKRKWYDTITQDADREKYFLTQKGASFKKRYDAYEPQYASTTFDKLTIGEWAQSIGRNSFMKKAGKYAKRLSEAKARIREQTGIRNDQTLTKMALDSNYELKALDKSNLDYVTALNNNDDFYPAYMDAQQAEGDYIQMKAQYFPKQVRLDIDKQYKHLAPLLQTVHRQNKLNVHERSPFVMQPAFVASFGGYFGGQLEHLMTSVDGVDIHLYNDLETHAKEIILHLLQSILGQDAFQELYSETNNTLMAINNIQLTQDQRDWCNTAVLIHAVNSLWIDMSRLNFKKLDQTFAGSAQYIEDMAQNIANMMDNDPDISWSGFSANITQSKGDILLRALKKEYNMIVKQGTNAARKASNNTYLRFFGDSIVDVPRIIKEAYLVLSLSVHNPYKTPNYQNDGAKRIGKVLDEGANAVRRLVKGANNTKETLFKIVEGLIIEVAKTFSGATYVDPERSYLLTDEERLKKKKARRDLRDVLSKIQGQQFAF